MLLSPPLARAWVQRGAWGALAVLLGLLAASAPPVVGGAALALAVFGVAILIEPALALVVMLSVAPLKVLIATEAPLPLPGDVGQWAFAAAVGAWGLWRVRHARFAAWPWSRVATALAIVLLGFGPSLFAAASTAAWLSEAVKWGEMLLLVLLVRDLGAGGRWSWIAFGIVLAAALQAALGLYEFFGGSGAPHLWISGYTRFRAFGTFGQPNPFSAFMGLSAPIALGLAYGYGMQAFGRWRGGAARAGWQSSAAIAGLYLGAAGLIVGGLLASWGRGAWLGFAGALTAMALFAPRRRAYGAALLLGGGGLALTLWASGLAPASIEQRITNTVDEFVGFRDVRGIFVTNENFSTVERLAHWQAAINMANAHPLVGVGLGNYETVYADYNVPRWPNALGHAHNDYLNLLAETGIIGLFAYVSGWALIVLWTMRALRLREPVMRGLALGLLGVWTHLALHSVVDKLYVNNLFLHIGVMLGLLALVDRARRCAVKEPGYGVSESN